MGRGRDGARETPTFHRPGASGKGVGWVVSYMLTSCAHGYRGNSNTAGFQRTATHNGTHPWRTAADGEVIYIYNSNTLLPSAKLLEMNASALLPAPPFLSGRARGPLELEDERLRNKACTSFVRAKPCGLEYDARPHTQCPYFCPNVECGHVSLTEHAVCVLQVRRVDNGGCTRTPA